LHNLRKVNGLVLRADGAISLAHAVIAMSQILAGIAYAHAKGLVHGDITRGDTLPRQPAEPMVPSTARSLAAFHDERIAAHGTQFNSHF
jgi:hypothetical protein